MANNTTKKTIEVGSLYLVSIHKGYAGYSRLESIDGLKLNFVTVTGDSLVKKGFHFTAVKRDVITAVDADFKALWSL